MRSNSNRSLVSVLAAALAMLIVRPAHAAQEIFSDGFEAGGTCHWSDGPCGQMVSVPAGTFTMGQGSAPGIDGNNPAHTVTLSAYHIDRNDVTVDEYAACVTGGGCSAPDGVYDATNPLDCNTGAPWSTTGSNYPINCVDWFQGQAYCTWAGKRYPTEAEWEKAARGTDARTYPWGEATPTCDYAVMNDPNAGGPGCGLDHTAPVGSKVGGMSPYGAFDMAGNVWDWVNDWYDPYYYYVSPPTDPPGPASGQDGERVLRGGSWLANYDSLNTLRSSHRRSFVPPYWDVSYGFRCARNG